MPDRPGEQGVVVAEADLGNALGGQRGSGAAARSAVVGGDTVAAYG